MIKTIKEIHDKALMLQGDYMTAFEDIMEALKNYVEEHEEALNEAPVHQTARDEVDSLKNFLEGEE